MSNTWRKPGSEAEADAHIHAGKEAAARSISECFMVALIMRIYAAKIYQLRENTKRPALFERGAERECVAAAVSR
jgi:hypothetical protein